MKYKIQGKTLYELFNDGTISKEIPFNGNIGNMIPELKTYFKVMSELKEDNSLPSQTSIPPKTKKPRKSKKKITE